MTACFSSRATRLQPFLAMEVMERAFEMERAGVRVLHLEVGEPDFAPPPAAVEACAQALRRGETRYTESRGLLELREAISADYARRFDARVDPERVLVTSGTSAAMLLVFSLLVDNDDEVVMGTPHYPCYPNFIRACGGTPVFVATDPARGYPLEPAAVRAALTPRTRAVLVSSPANPTGAVQSRETLQEIADLGVPIVSDEIYDGLVYDGARVTSALRVSDDAYVLGRRVGTSYHLLSDLAALQELKQERVVSRFVLAGVLVFHVPEGNVTASVHTGARRKWVDDDA